MARVISWVAMSMLCGWMGSGVRAREVTVMKDPVGFEIPREWVDKATGHRVRRLSRGAGEYRSFYFHNDPFLRDAAGDVLMAFNGTSPGDDQAFQPTTQQYWMQPSSNSVYTVNLRTGEVRHLTEAPRSEIIGRRSRTLFCPTADRSEIIGVDLLTGGKRTIAKLPAGEVRVKLSTLNADETLMAGTVVEDPWPADVKPAATKGERMQQTLAAKQMRRLVVFDLKSGELRTVLRDRIWFNHHQFSPTDPDLLMYCHEGPWHLVDRIWTVRVDDEPPVGKCMLKRTVDREIAGHEWWDPSGKTIWCDHQVPRSGRFFVTGIDVDGLERRSYELTRDEWSVHFTVSPDGKWFAGDGGSPGMVAKAEDGKWIYLFKPDDETHRFEATKLVNMTDHDYSLEPNVHFTPDQKWIVFRSNMHGKSHVYAVEIARPEAR